jgi:excisionase family DNA binding protein
MLGTPRVLGAEKESGSLLKLRSFGESGRARREKGIMADAREVMNIRQASQYLGVSPDTLYKYVGEQRIPAFKLGNRWRFKKSRLDQWMEEESSQNEAQARRKQKAATKAAGTQ